MTEEDVEHMETLTLLASRRLISELFEKGLSVDGIGVSMDAYFPVNAYREGAPCALGRAQGYRLNSALLFDPKSMLKCTRQMGAPFCI